MRIHTSNNYADVYRAAKVARADVVEISQHDSRTHDRAFEVKLEGESRCRPNGGAYGAGSGYAATWDQWGVFLNALFNNDRDMRVGGSVKRPIYADAYDFQGKTNGRFVGSGWPFDARTDHPDHTFRYVGTLVTGASLHRCTKCTAAKVYA